MRFSLATIVLVPRGATVHTGASEWGRVFDWATRAGFDGLEISPHWLNLQNTAELGDFRSAATAAGLFISGVNLNRCLFTRGQQADEALSRLKRALAAAEVLGAPQLTLSLSLPLDSSPRPILRGSDIPSAERQRACDVLRELAADAARNQIDLSLELHDDGMLDTAEYCLDMVRHIGAPNVGVNPDLGNLVRSTPSPADWERTLQELTPFANNWHVKNYRSGEPVPLWDGDIDYARAVPIMQAAGYRGWVSIESYFGNVIELQEQTLKHLRQLIEPAGTRHSPQESAA